MKHPTLTPVMLRAILSVVLLLLGGIGVGIFMVGYHQLQSFIASSQSVSTQAQSSASSLNGLTQTKEFLDKHATTVARASQLVAQSKSYIYQDQIISDINQCATEAGLSITNISFTDSTTATGSSTSSGASTSTAPTTTVPSAGSAASSTAPAVKSTTATVTLANPVNYVSMLNFIHLVEQSLFRMQISKISLSSSADAQGSNQVTSDALSIEVYIQ